MFNTIIWATDGSDLADTALPFIRRLADTHHSRIVAVHADEHLRGRFGGAPVLADEDDLRVKLRKQVEELGEAGLQIELKVEVSATHSPATLIAEAAEELDADLVVIATHGRGSAGSALLGSVAKALLHEAPCPVLVITPAAKLAGVYGAVGA